MTPPDASRRLRAIAAVLARQGYEASTVQQLASAAGVSRPGLYLHWRTKADLYAAAAAVALDDCSSEVTAILGREDGGAGVGALAAAAGAWSGCGLEQWAARDLPRLPEQAAETVRALLLAHRGALVTAVTDHARRHAHLGRWQGPGSRAGAAELGETVLALSVGVGQLAAGPWEREDRMRTALGVLVGPVPAAVPA